MSGWGGPVAEAAEIDGHKASVVEHLTGFCGVTTAHGAPRVFEDGSSLPRRLFWFCAFAGGLAMLILQVWNTITGYVSYATSSSIVFKRIQNSPVHLPQVTLCHSSPVKCGCRKWYPGANPKYYQGSCGASSTNTECKRWEDEVLPFLCYDNMATSETGSHPVFTYLDWDETRQNAQSFSRFVECDPELESKFDYDSGANATYLDLFQYAGYVNRSDILFDCHVEGLAMEGKSGDCKDTDDFWEQWFDADYGACHTFNGDSVIAEYNSDGTCVGNGCGLVQSGPASHEFGQGLSLVVNVRTDQSTPVFNLANKRYAPSILVHVHDSADRGLIPKSIKVGGGQNVDVRVHMKQTIMSNRFPYTNCTNDAAAIDPHQCEEECLDREIAAKCCGVSVDRLNGVTHPRDTLDPILNCTYRDYEELVQCVRTVKKDRQHGKVCQHPDTTHRGYTGKKGWYDTTTSSQKQSVAKRIEAGESMLYCPSLCNSMEFLPSYVTAHEALSAGAVREFATRLMYLNEARLEELSGSRTLTMEAAEQYVRENLAVVNIAFENFHVEEISISPAVTLEGFLGTIGGNLGMWVGISVMTILECCEWLLLAAIAGTCCVFASSKASPSKESEVGSAAPTQVGSAVYPATGMNNTMMPGLPPPANDTVGFPGQHMQSAGPSPALVQNRTPVPQMQPGFQSPMQQQLPDTPLQQYQQDGYSQRHGQIF